MVVLAIFVFLESPTRESTSCANLEIAFSHAGSGIEISGQMTDVAVWAAPETWHMSLIPTFAGLAPGWGLEFPEEFGAVVLYHAVVLKVYCGNALLMCLYEAGVLDLDLLQGIQNL